MASPPAFGKEFDGYIPMSPISMNSIKTNCIAESPVSLTSVGLGNEYDRDLVPPPVNRHLKPPKTGESELALVGLKFGVVHDILWQTKVP